MSREAHQSYLQKAALREAQRAFDRDHAAPTFRGFLALRVQTVEPWKRVLCVLVGAIFAAAAFWFSSGDQANVWAAGFFGVLALTSVVVGMIGWKRPVEAVLEATAEAVFNRILDAL